MVGWYLLRLICKPREIHELVPNNSRQLMDRLLSWDEAKQLEC